APPAAEAKTAAQLLAQAQDLYDQRETPGNVAQAMTCYNQVLSQNPDDFEAIWRLARCYWWEGDHAPQDKKISNYATGVQLAQRAQKIAPGKTEGYYWFGVCEGRAAEIRGVLNSLFAIEPIRQAMEKILEIDPGHGRAHHVLGVLYRKAPGWPLSCGNLNKSLEYARLAVEYAPEEVICRVGLAQTLIAKGLKDEAKSLLQEALLLPGAADQQPETKSDKETARTLLESLP
ncbi:tetratricopeptide repeat protein, partial [candidate division FCPU426 bacterium]|nr:tetratricopeptide repeat protein [candidate division FCPU426 bacterium]